MKELFFFFDGENEGVVNLEVTRKVFKNHKKTEKKSQLWL